MWGLNIALAFLCLAIGMLLIGGVYLLSLRIRGKHQPCLNAQEGVFAGISMKIPGNGRMGTKGSAFCDPGVGASVTFCYLARHG